MTIENIASKHCYELAVVKKNKDYKIQFDIDNDFHMRFDVINPQSKEHYGFLTKTIYSDAGHYGYILRPGIEGILCINKTEYENKWKYITNITVEEV